MTTTAVRVRPILFSAPMVRAILDGAKTQTRRVVTLREFQASTTAGYDWTWRNHRGCWEDYGTARFLRDCCPYGAVGDHLWLRETWQHADWTEDGEPFVRYRADDAVRFCADTPAGEALVDRWADLSDAANIAIDGKASDRRWRPSIFMPRWASRITLEITGVRVERLQEIAPEDCIAEGISPDMETHAGQYWREDAVGQYRDLWDSLNAKRAPWAANPFVWCISFKNVTP